jgi:hypothetical protein
MPLTFFYQKPFSPLSDATSSITIHSARAMTDPSEIPSSDARQLPRKQTRAIQIRAHATEFVESPTRRQSATIPSASKTMNVH